MKLLIKFVAAIQILLIVLSPIYQTVAYASTFCDIEPDAPQCQESQPPAPEPEASEAPAPPASEPESSEAPAPVNQPSAGQQQPADESNYCADHPWDIASCGGGDQGGEQAQPAASEEPHPYCDDHYFEQGCPGYTPPDTSPDHYCADHPWDTATCGGGQQPPATQYHYCDDHYYEEGCPGYVVSPAYIENTPPGETAPSGTPQDNNPGMDGAPGQGNYCDYHYYERGCPGFKVPGSVEYCLEYPWDPVNCASRTYSQPESSEQPSASSTLNNCDYHYYEKGCPGYKEPGSAVYCAEYTWDTVNCNQGVTSQLTPSEQYIGSTPSAGGSGYSIFGNDCTNHYYEKGCGGYKEPGSPEYCAEYTWDTVNCSRGIASQLTPSEQPFSVNSTSSSVAPSTGGACEPHLVANCAYQSCDATAGENVCYDQYLDANCNYQYQRAGYSGQSCGRKGSIAPAQKEAECQSQGLSYDAALNECSLQSIGGAQPTAAVTTPSGQCHPALEYYDYSQGRCLPNSLAAASIAPPTEKCTPVQDDCARVECSLNVDRKSVV